MPSSTLRPKGLSSIKQAKVADLRAVSDDKERLSVDHECLDIVRFANLKDVNVLDLDELVG